MKFQALKGAHMVDSSQQLNQCFLKIAYGRVSPTAYRPSPSSAVTARFPPFRLALTIAS